MKTKIYIKDWLELKPYSKQTATDSYYLKLCNEVKRAVTMNKQSPVLYAYIDDRSIDILACFLTSYFEDIISNTNIWNSFVRIHKRLYQKQLPFYPLETYYEKEINTQDICFLIWYFLNTVQELKFIAPRHTFIIEMANSVMDLFENAWDDAPENTHLKTFYQIDENEKNFYIARNLIDTILFKTYLFYTDTRIELTIQELEIEEEYQDDQNLLSILNDNRDNATHKMHTRLLSLKGKEWASEILGDTHALSQSFSSISPKIFGMFLYKGQDEYDLFIEHVASSKTFKLTKKSIANLELIEKIDTMLFIGIVRWQEEWWFSGAYYQQPFDSEAVLKEKDSLGSKIQVSFLDHDENNTDPIVQQQMDVFLDYNNGSPIAFMNADKIEDFYMDYIQFFNASLNLSKKEYEEAVKKAQKECKYRDQRNEENDSPETDETGLFFFNPKSGGEIAIGINSAFPLKNNPFFKESESEKNLFHLMMSEDFSTELVMYCINNCKTDLLFFYRADGQAYLEDLDFLLRFGKGEQYHSKPIFTFTKESKTS